MGWGEGKIRGVELCSPFGLLTLLPFLLPFQARPGTDPTVGLKEPMLWSGGSWSACEEEMGGRL